jgi:type II secretory pathway pseudopilin PulG
MELGRQDLTSEEGYTLLETVVAMSIFLAVAIPLVGMLAKVTLDRSPDELREALALAQSEVSRIEGGLPINSEVTHKSRLMVRSTLRDTLGTTLIQVQILSRRDSTRVILAIEKTIGAGGSR